MKKFYLEWPLHHLLVLGSSHHEFGHPGLGRNIGKTAVLYFYFQVPLDRPKT